MCGIAGAIGTIDRELAAAMMRASECQRHRGPDDEGCFSSVKNDRSGEGAFFAFRRLAIIDLSPDAHQPMIDPDTGCVLIFNGEIYNYRQLRAELEREGASFRSQSDSEVLLKSYSRWGVEAVPRLRGMFAFAIWDPRPPRGRVLLARDRLGIKPLYVASIERAGRGKTLIFASELRSLLASGLVARRLNPAGLSTYVWNGFVVGPETIIEGVQIMPAGTLATVDPASARLDLHRYWQLPDERPRNGGQGVERLRAALRTAMQQHLISDVPLGVFLSGGIDSSAVAALAVEVADAPVRTFNISFDEAEYDESPHARKVAAALGTEHVDVRLTQRHFREQLPCALNSLDQPTFDAINTYFVSRAVREAGITVALAGTGGDELFGGYPSFVDIPRAARLARRLRWMPESVLRALAMGVARLRLGRFGEVPPQTRWGKLGDALATRGRLVDAYQVSYGLFTQDFHAHLVDEQAQSVPLGIPRGRAHELSALIRGNPELHAISMLELSNYNGERLLRDTDAASMAVSLEARVPLLDHEVIEAAAAIDPARRFLPLGKKALLRELALRDLDPRMFERPKSGFVLPIERWCRAQLKDEVAGTLADAGLCASAGLNHKAVVRLWRAFEAGAPGMYWSRVWAVFVLLWWCREHKVSL